MCYPIGPSVDDGHTAVVDAQRIAANLRHHRLEPLPERGASGHDFDLPRMVDRNSDPIGRAEPAFLNENGNACPDRLAGGAALPEFCL